MSKSLNYLTDGYLGQAVILRYNPIFDWTKYFPKLKEEWRKYFIKPEEIKKILIGTIPGVLGFFAFFVEEVFINYKERKKCVFDVVQTPLLNPPQIYNPEEAFPLLSKLRANQEDVDFFNFYLTQPLFEYEDMVEPRVEVRERLTLFLTKELKNFCTPESKILVILPDELVALLLEMFKVLPLSHFKYYTLSLCLYKGRKSDGLLFDLMIIETLRKFLSTTFIK